MSYEDYTVDDYNDVDMITCPGCLGYLDRTILVNGACPWCEEDLSTYTPATPEDDDVDFQQAIDEGDFDDDA